MNDISNPLIPIALPLFLFLIFWSVFYFAFPGLWHGLKYFAQKISVFVFRVGLKRFSTIHPHISLIKLYLPMVLILIFGGILAFYAGEFFGDLGQSFRLTDSRVYHIDQAVNLWFRTERFPGLTAFFTAITDIGGPGGMTIIALVIAFLLFRKERASAIYLAIAGIGGALLNVGLKLLYMRARPDVETAIAVAQGQSFPSGHAMGSFIVLCAIGYLLLRQKIIWKWKSAILAVIATLILLTGLSRVYLGVHWTSDIIAGWCAGTVWLAAATVAFETLLRIRQIKRGAAPAAAGVDVPDKPVDPEKVDTQKIASQAKKLEV